MIPYEIYKVYFIIELTCLRLVEELKGTDAKWGGYRLSAMLGYWLLIEIFAFTDVKCIVVKLK